MKIARFRHRGELKYGAIEGGNLRLIEGSIFDREIKPGPSIVSIEEVELSSPCDPSKIVCVGLNYKDHAKELSMELPKTPVIFLKPPTSVIGPGDNIVYPLSVKRLDYEAELSVIIKREAKAIPEADISDYILGYTCLNDITARDLQRKDGQWTRAKSFDTFCPIGPSISTDLDANDLKIELILNNDLRQSSHTDTLIFGIEYLISFISHIMTLLPGDIIATGTPKGVGPLSKGDVVEVRIEKIGSLSNRVI